VACNCKPVIIQNRLRRDGESVLAYERYLRSMRYLHGAITYYKRIRFCSDIGGASKRQCACVDACAFRSTKDGLVPKQGGRK